MGAFRTLDDAGDLKGKRVLIRVDLNVPMADGQVSDDTRIRASAPTIRDVTDRGGKAILLAHFGRPKDGPDPQFSLAQVVPGVAAVLGKPVAFTLANHWALSTLSGLMGTITSVGAPPMAILYQGQRPEKIRPTLNALFFAGCVIGLVSLGLAGRLMMEHLVLSAIILPGVFAGIWLARYFRTDSAKKLSAVMLIVSGAAAAVLILKGLGIFA